MEMAKMKVSSRSETGSRYSRRLRKQGQIPGVIYGHGQPAQPIILQEHEVELVLLHGERLLEIDMDGTKSNALIKDVQQDTFGMEILHVDLTRVNLDERVEVTVPIVLRGTPVGSQEEDGVLQQISAEAYIECVVTDIPDELRLSVVDLNVGDSLHMSDLELPSGAKLLDDPEQMICTVSIITEAELPEQEEEGAEAAEPEVIGERREEEDQEGEGGEEDQE